MKKPKYGNMPAYRESVAYRFASAAEARRYDELMLMQQAGEIRGLKLQPEFTLQEAYRTDKGERVQAIRYVADFAYYRKTAEDSTGRTYWILEVEDVKGVKTEAYKLKRKMFREKYGFGIREIKA